MLKIRNTKNGLFLRLEHYLGKPYLVEHIWASPFDQKYQDALQGLFRSGQAQIEQIDLTVQGFIPGTPYEIIPWEAK